LFAPTIKEKIPQKQFYEIIEDLKKGYVPPVYHALIRGQPCIAFRPYESDEEEKMPSFDKYPKRNVPPSVSRIPVEKKMPSSDDVGPGDIPKAIADHLAGNTKGLIVTSDGDKADDLISKSHESKTEDLIWESDRGETEAADRLEGNAIGRITTADLECNIGREGENVFRAINSDGFPYARLLDTKGTWEYDYKKAIAAADLVNRRSLIMGHGVEATPLTRLFSD
jgi:hypothetical protein